MNKQSLRTLTSCCLAGLIAMAPESFSQTAAPSGKKAKPVKKASGYDSSVPKATLTAVRYGKHERHILDFWKAKSVKSDQPTPLVFVIHGGGWVGGSKERLNRFADPQALLDAGISVVSINYRLMRHSQDVVPPVKAPLHDAARALQFVRSNYVKILEHRI